MKKSHTFRVLFWLVLALFAASCTADEPVRPEPTATAAEEPTVGEAQEPEEPREVTPEPTPEPPAPTLADEELAEVVELDAGEQIEDAQGNLVAIYGYRRWPVSFEALSDETQAAFPFLGDFVELGEAQAELVAVDVAMCSAGIDATGFGTAEFFVHRSASEPLLAGVGEGHGLFAPYPVVGPGFVFPDPAECARGWVPVLWASGADATVARYLVTTRSSASAEVERHLYQWDIDTVDLDTDVDTAEAEPPESFRAGETVTFNDGPLADTTVNVQGWAELVGRDGPLSGTRLVAVRLEACPTNDIWPEFGIALNGWNLTAPLDAQGQFAAVAGSCFDGWLEFAVPFGAIPTAFFASDGADAIYGYAEWSLVNAAIAPPGA